MHLQSIFTVLFQGLLCKWWLPKPTKNVKPLPVWGPCFFHWPLHWKVEHLWEAQNVSLADDDKQKSLSEQSDSLYEWKKHKTLVRANGGESLGSDWKSQGEVPQSTAFKAKMLDVLFSVKSGEFKPEHAAGVLTCRLAEPNHPWAWRVLFNNLQD